DLIVEAPHFALGLLRVCFRAQLLEVDPVSTAPLFEQVEGILEGVFDLSDDITIGVPLVVLLREAEHHAPLGERTSFAPSVTVVRYSFNQPLVVLDISAMQIVSHTHSASAVCKTRAQRIHSIFLCSAHSFRVRATRWGRGFTTGRPDSAASSFSRA